MNREIKFRMWAREGDWEEDGDKRQFEMIDSDSLSFSENKPLKDLLKDIPNEQVIMQYSGLKDRHGVEIYEGDIVPVPTWPYDPSNGDDPLTFLTVSFDNGCFWIGTDHISDYDLGNKEVEVIGNIYQNPELLNDTKAI